MMLPSLPQVPYHKSGDQYSRKVCKHSFAHKGRRAKAVAKRRKARKLRRAN
jgi:hypothetical protein